MSQIADTEQFQRHRPHLAAVAYRMLGSVSEADDALQEAWLRVNRSRQETIHNARAWLTTIVGRVCIDMLRARQSRREDYVGSWVPEPIVTLDEQADPEHHALVAESVGLALLMVLETLTPAERVAYVLHGLLIKTHRGPLGAIGFTVTRGLITTIELTLDPDKLEDVDQLLGHPQVRAQAVDDGFALEREPGWISVPLDSERGIKHALAFLRGNYERRQAEKGPGATSAETQKPPV